jgi:hypothetical protein
VVEAMLDGLVELAIRSPNETVRQGAVSYISTVGSERWDIGIPIVARLKRVYDESTEWSTRETVLTQLRWQADKRAAADVLGQIAVLPETADRHQVMYSERAIGLLVSLGRQGQSVLRQLVRQDRIQIPQVSASAQAAVRQLDRPPDR